MLTKLAASVTALGVITGGIFAADARYAPATAVAALETRLTVDSIFRLVNEAREQGSPKYLCDAIEKEFVALCTDQPDHYLCAARAEMLERAGC